MELATYFKASTGRDFNAVDARQFVGAEYSSSAGFRKAHQWLANEGLLEQEPNSGNSCGV